MKWWLSLVVFLLGISYGCKSDSQQTIEEIEPTKDTLIVEEPQDVVVGAARLSKYLEQLANKSVALVVNQTSRIGDVHLVDTLLSRGVSIKTIFAPEHGFRGTADAGEKISDGKDSKTGLPIISLYGKNKKPKASQLAGIDIVIFDIQDVGTRFYTYISTMSYVMEACAENGVKVLVLDRPNPNGHYVDGPVLQKGFNSFVGLHQVPIVHGMTVGEYATMVNEEGWLKNGIKCDLNVVTCENYDHTVFYQLPIKPSPNLPNMRSIYLYPSLCLFEGTVVSVGRGTPTPFQIYGNPKFNEGIYEFTPKSTAGAKYPKHQNKVCNGYSLLEIPIAQFQQPGNSSFHLTYLTNFYKDMPTKDGFFNNFFDKLAGNSSLRKAIIANKSPEEIRESWQEELTIFKTKRKQYLLYKDFE